MPTHIFYILNNILTPIYLYYLELIKRKEILSHQAQFLVMGTGMQVFWQSYGSVCLCFVLGIFQFPCLAYSAGIPWWYPIQPLTWPSPV